MASVMIGIPARNEARFIGQTLDSVLAQDFTDWNLLVSDNASTDGTDQIVREYAARDRRIRLDRVSTAVSQVENFNRLAGGVSAPYFVWLGGHDRWAPSFLSCCLD
ncbi:glycosyltransferase family 2 protein, partial [Streptomyces sp. WAC04770]